MEGDEPTDENFSCASNSSARGKRQTTGHSAKAANSHFCNFGRLVKFLRPDSPEDDRERKESNRQNGIDSDKPCRGHLMPKENQIGPAFRPDEISVEDLLVGKNSNGEHGKQNE